MYTKADGSIGRCWTLDLALTPRFNPILDFDGIRDELFLNVLNMLNVGA